MTALPQATLIGIDVETGTFDRVAAPLQSIGVQVYSVDLDTWQIDHRSTAFYAQIRVDPDTLIEPRALAVHGLDPNAGEAVGEAEALMGLHYLIAAERARTDRVMLVSHWAQSDSIRLCSACERRGLPTLDVRGWRCSKHVYRSWLDAHGRIFAKAGQRELAIESGVWDEIEADEYHHDALADARATAEGYAWLMRQLRQMRQLGQG